MKITGRRKRKNVNIADSGALSDLAFLLIVFFIVIAVFTVNQGFILGLPRKESKKIVHVDDIIKITMDENNKLYFNDENISYEEAENILIEKLASRPKMTFLLKIKKGAKYQNVVDVLNIVQKLNIDSFSFSMLKEGEK